MWVCRKSGWKYGKCAESVWQYKKLGGNLGIPVEVKHNSSGNDKGWR